VAGAAPSVTSSPKRRAFFFNASTARARCAASYAAAYTGEYFQNRGLFSDYFLRDRLREDPAWRDNPSDTLAFVRDLMRDAQTRWNGKDKDTLRNELLEPLFKKLGFKAKVNRPSKTDQTQPDYLLNTGDGGKLTAAFVYAWDRWRDGPDLNDTDTPEENPGACGVTARDAGTADWIIAGAYAQLMLPTSYHV